jgi:hypothetical protein
MLFIRQAYKVMVRFEGGNWHTGHFLTEEAADEWYAYLCRAYGDIPHVTLGGVEGGWLLSPPSGMRTAVAFWPELGHPRAMAQASIGRVLVAREKEQAKEKTNV